jgi:hypothetical protein
MLFRINPTSAFPGSISLAFSAMPTAASNLQKPTSMLVPGKESDHRSSTCFRIVPSKCHVDLGLDNMYI